MMTFSCLPRILLLLLLLGLLKGGLLPAQLESQAGAHEQARPLKTQELANIKALGRLVSLLKSWHPSDQLLRVNWNLVGAEGLLAVALAASPEELAHRLEEFFLPLAPTLRVFPRGRPGGLATGLHKPRTPWPLSIVYITSQSRARVGGKVDPWGRAVFELRGRKPPQRVPDPRRPLELELGSGVNCRLPLGLWLERGHTLPHVTERWQPRRVSRGIVANPRYRVARLLAVLQIQSLIRQFHPAFETFQEAWQAQLDGVLRQAALDDNVADFHRLLLRMLVPLGDNLVGLVNTHQPRRGAPDLLWDVIQGQLCLTSVGPSLAALARRGDQVRRIGKRPALAALQEEEALICADNPSRRRRMALLELLLHPFGKPLSLELLGQAGEHRQVRLPLGPARKLRRHDPRPPPLTVLKPGLVYADWNRITDGTWRAQQTLLQKARGLILDLRGPCALLSGDPLRQLLQEPVTSPTFQTPEDRLPDRLGRLWRSTSVSFEPRPPRLKARLVFLTDVTTEGQGEIDLYVARQAKLGPSVGRPTAGAVGLRMRTRLAGGFLLLFNSQRVLDATLKPLAPIRPDHLIPRTQAALHSPRDPILEAAIKLLGF